MNLIFTAFVISLFVCSHASNITEEASVNKTKRTVAGQVQTYGENRPVVLLSDTPGGPLPIYAPVTIKPVFDPEVPKQVAAQQVLYEFQQTPTNAVSNVHVNQFYQPVQPKPDSALPPNTGPAQFISGSESVATPVQHSSLIRHGQNFGQVQFHPLQVAPHHVQTQQYIPGKYLYVNGKIIYQPHQQSNINQQNNLNNQPNIFPRPANFLYQHPQINTQKFITPTPMFRQMRLRQFQPPQPNQFQPITKPMKAPEVTEEQNEEETAEEAPRENEETEEEEEEDNDEKGSYEENDDGDDYFSKYSFDDDEHNEDDDEDNERGSSKHVPKKHKKSNKPNKYNKSSNFKYSENYSSSSKYEKPMKKGKKGLKNPKMHYKAVKYTREGGRPRTEKIEGNQSQNVPVIHKQKIFKEKWFVTKSTDDSRI